MLVDFLYIKHKHVGVIVNNCQIVMLKFSYFVVVELLGVGILPTLEH